MISLPLLPSTVSLYQSIRLRGYNDTDKADILTQSPTIQRVSQRLVIAVALGEEGMIVKLHDVTQAYPQAKSKLARVFLAKLPLLTCLCSLLIASAV